LLASIPRKRERLRERSDQSIQLEPIPLQPPGVSFDCASFDRAKACASGRIRTQTLEYFKRLKNIIYSGNYIIYYDPKVASQFLGCLSALQGDAKLSKLNLRNLRECPPGGFSLWGCLLLRRPRLFTDSISRRGEHDGAVRQKVRARHIGDFSKWKSQDGYQQAIKRVLRDLTMSE
jgi:hypothetical protein